MGNVDAELLRAIPGLPDTKKRAKGGSRAPEAGSLNLPCGTDPSKVPQPEPSVLGLGCEAFCQVRGVESCDQTRENIHAVVSAKNEHDCGFETYDRDPTRREPAPAKARQLADSKYGDCGMSGKEIVMGHAVR